MMVIAERPPSGSASPLRRVKKVGWVQALAAARLEESDDGVGPDRGAVAATVSNAVSEDREGADRAAPVEHIPVAGHTGFGDDAR